YNCLPTPTSTVTNTLTNTPTNTATSTPTNTATNTVTPTMGCVSFTDTYPNASSLNNYDYFDASWVPSTAGGRSYSVAGGQLRETPSGGTGYSYLTVKNPLPFPSTLSSYTEEGDFKLDAGGQGVFGLVFLANAGAQHGYIFQWNGINSRWEI